MIPLNANIHALKIILIWVFIKASTFAIGENVIIGVDNRLKMF